MFGDFVIGGTYNRRQDIHRHFDGQQQGGIATPSGHPVVFAFTGNSGTQHGYDDGWTDAGVFRYFGEGQLGDMKWKGGNKAIRDHALQDKDLILFETLGKGKVRCLGQFFCAGYELVPAPDRAKATRQAIVFNLVPSDLAAQHDDHPPDELPTDLFALRKKAVSAATTGGEGKPSDAKRNYYARSAVVRAYVLARAAGVCECCRREAPFKTTSGAPYLEPHHIRRLSDGGPDHPAHVGAVCPNCHREAHHGVERAEINARLAETVRQTELAAERSLRGQIDPRAGGCTGEHN